MKRWVVRSGGCREKVSEERGCVGERPSAHNLVPVAVKEEKPKKARTRIKGQGKRGKRLAPADRSVSLDVRSIGRCEAQGFEGIECAGILTDAHIMKRRHQKTRHLPENQICLCLAHHDHFEHRARRWQAFVRLTKPGLWRRLWILSHHAEVA